MSFSALVSVVCAWTAMSQENSSVNSLDIPGYRSFDNLDLARVDIEPMVDFPGSENIAQCACDDDAYGQECRGFELYNGDTMFLFAFPEKLGSIAYLSNVRAPANYAPIPGYNLMWTTVTELAVTADLCAQLCDQQSCHGFTMYGGNCAVKVLNEQAGTSVVHFK